ncbi:MAG: hypothetical protein JW723_06225 [Bacteroidales bacterium]|nr:hypothetical protein [Bacteroidales bacterium]
MNHTDKIPPELSKIGKEKPFKVPEDYFENFSVRLSDRIHEKRSPEFTGRLIPVLKPFLAIAAVAVIVLIAVRIFVNQPGKEDMGNLKGDDLAFSISDNIYYYSEEAIIDAVYPPVESSVSEEHLTDEEIIEYLINEDISINDILNPI